MKYDSFIHDSYNLYTIKTDKFKNCHLEIIFRNKTDKKTITYLALLFDILMENNEDYKTKKMLSRKLQDLYNLNVYSVNSRVGNTLITNVVADFLDPKYMESDTLEEIIKLVFSLIFKPNVINGEFDEDTFLRVKNRLKTEILSIKEDPKQSSILSALKGLDKNSPRGFNSSGNIKILDEITNKKLYEFYLRILDESLIDVYLVGNINMKSADKIISKYSKFMSIKRNTLGLYLDYIPNKKIINIKEKNNLTQTNLVQIYSFNNLTEFELNYVVPIFNLLWGSGSLESKLYKSIRGDNSLCYNINTYYQKYDRVIVLHTAIDACNYNKTVKLIKSCLNEMITGNIEPSELENVKNILKTSLNLIYDSPNRLTDNYLFKNITNLPSVEDRIDEFNKVTLEDLKTLSKKIKLVLNYRIGE